jgi:septum formation protein
LGHLRSAACLPPRGADQVEGRVLRVDRNGLLVGWGARLGGGWCAARRGGAAGGGRRASASGERGCGRTVGRLAVLSDDGSVTRRHLVLASGSATRLRVLRDAGLDPEVVVSGVDEDTGSLDTARAVAMLAIRKAAAVAERRPDALVLACDSMLDLDGNALGRPSAPQEVIEVWRRLSGRQALLCTGHCLIEPGSGRRVVDVANTLVRFGTPSGQEIAAYIATGEPMQMAGCYTIQGLGAPFVEGVDGDPNNVLGLSVSLLRRMLAEVGVAITDLWRYPPRRS